MTRLLLLILPITLLPLELAAATAEEKGLAIAVESKQRNSGWIDQQADMEMILRNRQGEESKRSISTKTLEIDNDGDKSLTIFDSPKDIKGTAFLSFTHALVPNDQWLFLPALKRVKRIASANKSGPFVGSEFAYEDLSSLEVEKYDYKWLRDEDIQGLATFVVEQYPKYKHSGYTRVVTWYHQETYQPLQAEFYDRKDALLKTLVFDDYEQYLDRYWRAGRMHMVNHQTGKSTELLWRNYQFKTGLSVRDFDRNALKRAR